MDGFLILTLTALALCDVFDEYKTYTNKRHSNE